jgi:two-component system, OmpR family, sensor histidine kinase KdpD
MNENRADSFLRLIRRARRGRLKIYLGYAAGVGKTYQMLLEAHRLKADGIDVAVGLVETHGRAETEALLAGLEQIPRRRISYRGIEIDELDLEAVLARRPAVALVDELAHTNVPGSKHAKRHQDVEAILAAGIHVISTLNIQHLESLYETVERATGVKVRERIPDPAVLEADQLVNVDITTEDLRRRLQEGKVYTSERIETALAHFFKPANLEQLRELALRELAAQIDARRRDPQAEDLTSSPDQVAVCLSSRGPNSGALLRYASRLAGRLNRNWYALYVQTAKEGPAAIDAATQRMLADTLTLAQQLGATVFTYKGEDVVKTILQFAKEYRVGHIVLGTPGRKVPFWQRLRGTGSIVERLVTEGTGVTVVVLDTKALPGERPGRTPSVSTETTDRGIIEKEPATPENRLGLWQSPVVFWDNPIDKELALGQLLEACVRGRRDDAPSLREALAERERQGSTLVGADVAIPHARVPGLARPLVALGIGPKGILDRASGREVKIMWLLLSPLEYPERHLALLGAISRMARDDPFRREILAAGRADSVSAAIRAWEARFRAADRSRRP